MSFVDDLLTIKEDTDEGEEILRFPRSWNDFLPWKRKQPFSYRAHLTKGGLYLVLPHNQDGSLFADYPKEKFVEKKGFHYPCPSIGSFHMQQAMVERDEGLQFGSLLAREQFHAETKTSLRIYIYYKAVGFSPSSLRISYGMIFGQAYFKSVFFDIAKDDTGKASAKGPHVHTNLNQSEERLYLVKQDPTLENLVELITAPELGPEQFSPLLTNAFLERHALH